MSEKNIISLLMVIIIGLVGYIFLFDKSSAPVTGGELTEKELEEYFRKHTVSGNHVAAIKLQFTIPESGTAYLGTIHGYPNNLQVCEELIAPFNEDPSLTTIPGGTYYCELLR